MENIPKTRISEGDKVFFPNGEASIMLLDDFRDWFVTLKDIKKFRKLWNENVPFVQMCRRLDMTGDQLLILILDQSRKGSIEPRRIGIGI